MNPDKARHYAQPSETLVPLTLGVVNGPPNTQQRYPGVPAVSRHTGTSGPHHPTGAVGGLVLGADFG